MAHVAIAPDLFTESADGPALIGSTCEACGATTFPIQAHCPRCSKATMVQRLLPRRGRLVAWTTQEFRPKAPYAGGDTDETFIPFGVGLVQLGDQVRVEGRLTEADPAVLTFGMAVQLVVVPFRVEADGTEVVTFAFAPDREHLP